MPPLSLLPSSSLHTLQPLFFLWHFFSLSLSFLLEDNYFKWMWGLDHKEDRVRKNWSFQTLVLEKTLESPLDSKEIKPANPKGNQSWIFIGRTELKLKLQYFGHLTWRDNSLEKTLMLGKIEGRRRRVDRGWDGWMASLASLDMSLSKVWELLKDREAWCVVVHGVTRSRTPPSDWKTTISFWNIQIYLNWL